MNFAALWARNSGRATPSLRCTPKAPTKETRQEATYLQREAVQTTGASSLLRRFLGDGWTIRGELRAGFVTTVAYEQIIAVPSGERFALLLATANELG